MGASMKAWHFVGETLRDGSPIPLDGVWLEWHKPLAMCSQGFHASIHPFDALFYAPGPTLCHVLVNGDIIQENDKLVASQRLIVKRIDFTEQLFLFSRQQALKVVHNWNAPDVVIQFLKTGDKDLRNAAESAARSAAESAFVQTQRDEFLQLVEKEFT